MDEFDYINNYIVGECPIADELLIKTSLSFQFKKHFKDLINKAGPAVELYAHLYLIKLINSIKVKYNLTTKILKPISSIPCSHCLTEAVKVDSLLVIRFRPISEL